MLQNEKGPKSKPSVLCVVAIETCKEVEWGRKDLVSFTQE